MHAVAAAEVIFGSSITGSGLAMMHSSENMLLIVPTLQRTKSAPKAHQKGHAPKGSDSIDLLCCTPPKATRKPSPAQPEQQLDLRLDLGHLGGRGTAFALGLKTLPVQTLDLIRQRRSGCPGACQRAPESSNEAFF